MDNAIKIVVIVLIAFLGYVYYDQTAYTNCAVSKELCKEMYR